MTKEKRKKVIKQQHILAQIMMTMFDLFLAYCVGFAISIDDKMTYDCTSFELLMLAFGVIGMFYLFSVVFPIASHGAIHDYYLKKRMRVDDPDWKFANEY